MLSPTGELVKEIPPAFRLDDLICSAARYACGQDIPTVLAQQAVFFQMTNDGYSVRWLELSDADAAL
ncbi:hypothetical protein [Burkholderia lata]|uniref:hypothetical protein n=1 Tax=Burkholderia lata (strain ATCC 17760 / DSM 23089 / LMG 22485 / NCIMB 9086 / R18194 / 383) TaxID=482957 RepID=UPI001584076A|nr:hypothetical protein [Burkholderia lata]